MRPNAVAAWGRLHFDFTVVQLHDAEDHRQVDAAPLLLGREIQIEDPRQVLRRDTDAGVFDEEPTPPRDASRQPRHSVPPSGIACSALMFSTACISMP